MNNERGSARNAGLKRRRGTPSSLPCLVAPRSPREHRFRPAHFELRGFGEPELGQARNTGFVRRVSNSGASASSSSAGRGTPSLSGAFQTPRLRRARARPGAEHRLCPARFKRRTELATPNRTTTDYKLQKELESNLEKQTNCRREFCKNVKTLQREWRLFAY